MLPLAALMQLPLFGGMASQKPADVTDLLAHLLLVHNLSGEHVFRISGPFWSIALECQLYLVFPVLLACMRRPLLPLALALASGLWMWTHAPDFPSYEAQFAYWSSLPSLLILFVLGMLAARAVARGVRLGNAGAVSGFVCCAVASWLPTDGPQARLVCQCCVAVGTALVLAGGEDSLVARALQWRPLVRVGLASYTLYLTHNPLVSLVGKLAAHRLAGAPLYLTALLSMALAVAGALAMFPILEKPFHELARRRVAVPRVDSPGGAAP
jgi:peptidoglycan/LPS O-acetylase OafA/YrhL